jgi:hypothetical protein
VYGVSWEAVGHLAASPNLDNLRQLRIASDRTPGWFSRLHQRLGERLVIG